jgi:flagellar protein FliO/FliZ
MEWQALMQAMGALLLVVALIIGAAYLSRRLGIEKKLAGLRKDARLRVIETVSLDMRHRVVIVRRDAREHVLVLGPSQIQVVESYDAPNA